MVYINQVILFQFQQQFSGQKGLSAGILEGNHVTVSFLLAIKSDNFSNSEDDPGGNNNPQFHTLKSYLNVEKNNGSLNWQELQRSPSIPSIFTDEENEAQRD